MTSPDEPPQAPPGGRRVLVLSDAHYAGPAEQARGRNFEWAGAPWSPGRLVVQMIRHWIWMRNPLAHNHQLAACLAQTGQPDLVVANGDFSCDSAAIGLADAAARESASLCLARLRDRFGGRLRTVLGDHELGKVSLLGDRGGLRLESLARATGECGIPPFWREPLGRFDLVGICSTLVALPVFRAEALPGEWPEWERRRAEHLAQVREVFAGLEAGRRLVLFCHDPTALPFLWAEPVVRERAQQIALTIVGHLHTPLVFGLAQRLAGVPPVNFLGVAVRRITGALNRAQCWRPFRVALCPSLAGCQLLKDGGFLTLDLDDAAGGRWRLRRHRLPW